MKGRRNVQVNREDFNLLLLIVVFVVFQDHFLSITATMMDFCWKHCATHIFYLLPGKYFLQHQKLQETFSPRKNLFFFFLPVVSMKELLSVK